MKPASLGAYALAARLASPLVPGLLAGRARRGKEDLARIGERLGKAGLTRPSGPLVWLHGASVGESLSLLPVIEGLRARRPDLVILATSGTVASAELMARRMPEGCIHQYAPVDTPGAAARFIRHWTPSLAVFVESELWPNLLFAARAAGARTALVSARLSAASLDGWKRLPGAARAVLGGFDLVMAQDDPCAERLASLGARDDGRLNLKLAGNALPVDAGARATILAQLGGRPLLLAASTHPGEDVVVLESLAGLEGQALMVIAPRHPVRGAEVVALSRGRGLRTAHRGVGEDIDPLTDVLVADTLGELGLWFSLARLALVAGSLVEGVGGHNPLEPARLSCPFVSGPFVSNWTEVYASLAAVDGYRTVSDPASLATAWRDALATPDPFRAMADRAGEVAAQGAHALDGALDRLAELAAP